MYQWLFIAVGGALGALARFGLANTLNALIPLRLPLATLTVNIVGSLLIGVIYVLIAEKMILQQEWRSILMVGFLGAFTTFSTFSLETVTLLENGQFGIALAYCVVSVITCVGAAYAGLLLARNVV